MRRRLSHVFAALLMKRESWTQTEKTRVLAPSAFTFTMKFLSSRRELQFVDY